jgi:hypothetical protein
VPGLGVPPLGQVPVPEPPHGRTDGTMGIDGLIHKTITGSVAAGPWTRPYGRSNAIDHPDGERGSAVPICESSLRCRAQLEGCGGNWAGPRGRQAPLPVTLAPRPQPLALVSKIPFRGMSRLPNPTAQLRAVHSRRLPAQQSIGRRPAPGETKTSPNPLVRSSASADVRLVAVPSAEAARMASPSGIENGPSLRLVLRTPTEEPK